MKTIFDTSVREELQKRIIALSETHKASWGKMTVSQMTKHCTYWNDWVLGRQSFEYRQEFLGKVFGKVALKSNTKDDTPMGKNMPAGKGFVIKETDINLHDQKTLWLDQINAYENYSNDAFVHDFFGKMTIEQIGIFAYKHHDHHLRQFGV